ncbi:MAG: hypothetical protein HY966_05040, partial [Ignavibacteriales bacterium]|nr:hypothetical protein [Ignavibacteriales bacterium]
RPEAYLKPLHLAGKWIADNTSTTSVVLSRWKDVAFFLNNRPLLDKDPQMTPEAFSNLIRDYGITHLVAVASNNGLREYEALMCMLPHYRFETIHKVGSVEIVAVQRMGGTGNVHGDSTTVADSARWSFHKALELLAEPTAQEAESLLTQLAARTGKYGNVILHLAIAKEFGGKLDEADQILNRFQSVPQAGVFLQQAWYHKEIISRVRDAVAEQDPSLRASKFNVVAVNYRELGFRNQSYVMLNKSLQADSTFFPSLIFYAVYAYADGDVNLASKYLRKAAVENSTHILVSNLRRVLAARAELDRVHDHAARASLRLQIVDCLTAIGMREDAISELLLLLREDPQNSKALLHLAELYEVKRRFAPMRRALERYVGLNPQDQPQIVRLNELRKKWD